MQAFILAAGLGRRLLPYTKYLPKPSLHLENKPLITHWLDALYRAGFYSIALNVSYQPEVLTNIVHQWRNQQPKGNKLDIKIFYEGTHQLETGLGLWQMVESLAITQPFFVANADVWMDFAYLNPLPVVQTLQNQHTYVGMSYLVSNIPPHKGDFGLSAPNTLGQQKLHPGLPKFTYSGFGVYTREIFTGFTHQQTPWSFAHALRQGAQKGNLLAQWWPYTWVDIGTPERYYALKQNLARPKNEFFSETKNFNLF